MDKIKEYAMKGISIAVAYDIHCFYYSQPTWYYRVGCGNDTDLSYGYDSFDEALEEAYPIADWYLSDIGL